MALITGNNTKVKFYTGAKASYNEATHGQGVYFCNDVPQIHANGVWTGVSNVQLTGKTLKIKIGDVWDKTSSAYVAQFVSVSLADIVPNDIKIANWDTAYEFVSKIGGTDTDTVINKWQEVVDFLANISSTTDLSSLLAAKANSSVTISAGTGLTGGGNLTENRTLSLATVGTAGTYIKVTTDSYGRVTSGSKAIAISEVTDLQTTLNAKVPNTRKVSTKTPLKGGGALSSDLTLSLGYVSSEFKVNTSGENIGLLQLNAVPLSKVTGLQTALNSKLETSNIKAGDGINVTTSTTTNDVTIKTALYGGTTGSALEIVQSGTDATTKGLRVKVDDTTIKIDDATNAIAIKSIDSFVVDNLKSDSTTTALSANQGNVLDGKITSLKVDVNANSLAITNINSNISSLTTSVSALETQLTWVVVS